MDQSLGFSTGRYRRSVLAAMVGAPALFALVAWPMIAAGLNTGRGAADALNYHEKVIRTFIQQWPNPDLTDYLSATTPGYHLLVATFGKYVSDSRMAMQFAASLITMALFATIASAAAWRMRRYVNASGVIAICLPLMASMYVLSSGVWLLPDNAAWLGVTAMLLLALRRGQSWLGWILAGVALVALVLCRQNHLWAAGLVWVAAWLGPGPARGETPLFQRQDIGGLIVPRIGRFIVALLVTMPAFAVVWGFHSKWGGLTPPSFNDMHGLAIQWATPPFVLALVGIFGWFYVAFWWESLRKLVNEQAWIAFLAAIVGLVLAVLPETTPDRTAGRATGLWHIVRKTPQIADHISVLVAFLSMMGAVVLMGWLRAMNPRSRWIMLAAMVGFTVANSFNPQLWQRYHEPFVLIWTILAASLAVWSGERLEGPTRRVAVFGPTILALLLAYVSFRGIGLGREAVDGGFTPGHVEPSGLDRGE